MIGLRKRLPKCVEWDIKPQISQSVWTCASCWALTETVHILLNTNSLCLLRLPICLSPSTSVIVQRLIHYHLLHSKIWPSESLGSLIPALTILWSLQLLRLNQEERRCSKWSLQWNAVMIVIWFCHCQVKNKPYGACLLFVLSLIMIIVFCYYLRIMQILEPIHYILCIVSAMCPLAFLPLCTCHRTFSINP